MSPRPTVHYARHLRISRSRCRTRRSDPYNCDCRRHHVRVDRRIDVYSTIDGEPNVDLLTIHSPTADDLPFPQITLLFTKAISDFFGGGGISDQMIRFNGFPFLEKEDKEADDVAYLEPSECT